MARRDRQKRRADDELPAVYRELLAEAEAEASASASHGSDEGRIRKRRRVGNRGLETPSLEKASTKPEGDVEQQEKRPSPLQVAVKEPESSEESDIGWEDVELRPEQASEDLDTDGGLDIVLDEKEARQRAPRPKNAASNAAQRQLRVALHKMHLLCLIPHVHLRNAWCNDPEIQAALKPLLPPRTTSFLNPSPHHPQFRRSSMFLDGLAQASDIWRGKFLKTARGLRRPNWAESPNDVDNLLPDDFDPPLQKEEFIQHARDPKASRDVGAQLFCALLRGIGVEARLVCSVQVLPFNPSAAKVSTPQKPPTTIIRTGVGNENNKQDSKPRVNPGVAASSPRPVGDSPSSAVPRLARRLGQPSFGVGPTGVDAGRAPVAEASKRKYIRESPYPVYWVEAFDTAIQKWTPVDPLATRTVAKPLKLEPPASDVENCMTYVLAFEDDGAARDVTRRYAKALNAKTRKMRIESTPGGEAWWKGVLRFYGRRYALDRDQVENAELAALEAQEPLPRNVQDFKDHPYYALERHLRRNQVIHPKKEVGKVAAGKSTSGSTSKVLEPIYRRRDVHVVRSADGWYKLGRDVKPGEQPLKQSAPRRSKKRASGQGAESDTSDGEGTEKGLYAEFQTVPYEPPPIINGRIPRNAYGNLDVFVPSMVPKGGVHIPNSGAGYAARLLGIDYADAVTGFEFRGRNGTPVVRGIVTAAEYQAAVEAVIGGLRDQEAEAEAVESSLDCLRLWKRFLLALRIHARIDIEGDNGGLQTDLRMIEHEDAGMDEGGGFFPERGQSEFAEPTAGRFTVADRLRGPSDNGEGGGGFMLDDDAEEALRESELVGGSTSTPFTGGQDRQAQSDDASRHKDMNLNQSHGDVEPGGFFQEVDSDGGGGFLPDASGQMNISPSPSNSRPNQFTNRPRDHEAAGYNSEPSTSTSITKHEQAALALRDVSRAKPVPEDQRLRVAAGREQNGTSAISSKATPTERPSSMSKLARSTDGQDDDEADEKKHIAHDDEDDHVEDDGDDDDDDADDADDDDDALEQGSLLSHDPEDDDADPEWLMSD